MTAIEFMRRLHPDAVNPIARGGCFGCPCDYGIEIERGQEWCGNCELCWQSRVISWSSEADTERNK